MIVVHHKGVYNLYSGISDGAYFNSGVTLEKLKQEVQEVAAKLALKRLEDVLPRVHAIGTSDMLAKSLPDTLTANRAGPNETYLNPTQFIAQFLTLEENKK